MEYEYYVDPIPSFEVGLNMLLTVYDEYGYGTIYEQAVQTYITEHQKEENPIIYLSIPDYPTWESSNGKYKGLRAEEIKTAYGEYDSIVYWDYTNWNRYDSLINLARTIFVCGLLGIGSYWFNKDATILVLNPLERMIERVRIVA